VLNSVNSFDIDFLELGEPDDIETFGGKEWIVSKSRWDTPAGPVFTVSVIKNINNSDYEKGLSIWSDMSNSELYNFNLLDETDDNNITEIDYEDVIPSTLSWAEQLEIAIENEDFEEATRLRDWNLELIKLLRDLKPKILTAIEEDDSERLEDCLKIIKDFKNTL